MKQIFTYALLMACVQSFAQYTLTDISPLLPPGATTIKACGDLNGDGEPDLVSITTDALYGIFHEGDLVFSDPVQLATLPTYSASSFFSMEHDFDGNGLVDFYCNPTDIAAYVMLQVSPGVFDEAVVLTDNSKVIGDADNDGDDEIIYNSSYALGDNIIAIDYAGGNTFADGDTLYLNCYQQDCGAINYYFPLYIVDYDGDGLNDLITEHLSNSFYAHVFEGSEFYQCCTPTDGTALSPFTNMNTMFIKFSDIDQTGNIDYIVHDNESTWCEVHVGATSDYFDFSIPSDWADFAEMNDDDHTDIISHGYYCDDDGNCSEGFYISYNNGNNQFPGIQDNDLNGGNSVFIPASSTFNDEQVWDFHADGKSEIVAYPNIISYSEITTISGVVYADNNANNIFDNDEFGLPNIPVTHNNGAIYYTSANGEFTIVVADGMHEVSIAYDGALWNNAGSDSFTFDVSGGVATPETTEFALIPIGSVSGLDVDITYATSAVCGSWIKQHINVTNTGNTMVEVGGASLVLDDLYAIAGFIDWAINPDASYVSGDTVSWSFTNLPPNQSFQCYVITIKPEATFAGEWIEHVAAATIEDGLGNILFFVNDTLAHVLECSFDPNDKITNTGWTESGYVLANTELDYTIQFQNTGNAPATNVRVEDQLSDLLQWNTLHPIAWSHDFDLMIDETGRAIFNFENIMLPDSTNNEEDSHGFVRFTIMQDENLPAWTEIENTAEIFFDLNEPVITNTTLNTIYDCADLEQVFVSATEACVGEEIICTNNAQWIVGLAWYFNDEYVAAGSFDYTVEESGLLMMQASNNLCTFQQEWNIIAISIEASFTQNGNTLTASEGDSYQWHDANGMIDGATSQTFEITQDGTYSLMVTDENGCSDVSDEMFVAYLDIQQWSNATMEQFKVVPNPITDFFTIRFSSFNAGDEFVVMDAIGRVVIREKITSKEMKVDAASWVSGVYEIRTSNNSISKKIVKE